jgi:hypothetical protein
MTEAEALKAEARARLEARSIPEPNSGCWLWELSLSTSGYGNLSFGGIIVRAHRLAWWAYRGEIPDGKFVCHRCDIRVCCNPDHLFLGNNSDNMRDMVAKQRHKPMLGTTNGGGRRLSREQVAAILADARPSHLAVARDYQVSEAMVRHIRAGRVWSAALMGKAA